MSENHLKALLKTELNENMKLIQSGQINLVKMIRDSLCMSLQEMADLADIHWQTLRNVENGLMPHYVTCHKLCIFCLERKEIIEMFQNMDLEITASIFKLGKKSTSRRKKKEA